ncbi:MULTISPECIES: RagB/SusD family nutrient uptake outer membrane protein [Bacteroides]|jgi:hypothetical protein|uniref:RagB/SusD family nutrient uptake outer membrane protein n=1 Tax=Bacteroides clarus TaxID=626929 RepID=A0A1Y3YST3_9BACE|nr:MULTISPECIES: RagB/SusD family nutrient uptake outer membrane protein [Bacteroides]MBD9144569.1 RagB/SusD family nutrient uptake outer membrane protein [Bacteroides clarus]MBS1306634.1 RagB/SusD family nutrient uptake outer membrane protein [Bacteroides sp.]OUO00915.1 RagB/SusD family nutrient uptake outer membrane protein [Bacteroides clarus]CDB82660.1 susD family protein [Bacteroides clarus CAG:160]
MKRLKYLYLSGLFSISILSLTSCSDILTEKPVNVYEKDDFFIREENAEMAVIGVYAGVTGDYNLWASDDIYYPNRTENDNGQSALCHYISTPANQSINSAWKNRYTALNRANYTIDGIQQMKGYRDNKKLQSLAAEVMFLRALVSFDLVRMWGDVPYTTEYSKNYEDTYKPRTDRQIIYDQIISDLDYAKKHLVWADNSSSPERATQGSARALLMRVQLHRAGYSLQMNGKLERPDEDKRKNYLNTVIEEWEAFQEEGGNFHGFYEDTENSYEALFKSFSAEKLNSKESLFEIAYQYPNRKGNFGTMIGVPVGQPVIASNEQNSVMGRAANQFQCLPEWNDFFEEADQRRQVMVAMHTWDWNTEQHTHVRREVTNTAYVGKWRREWMPLGYDDPNSSNANFCYIRYGEIVLTAAEAYNELGNTAKAWELINMIRKRAKATELSLSNYKSLMKAPKVWDLNFIDDSDETGKIRTVLFWERAFELAYEGVRKYDLIRWGIFKETLQLFGQKTVANQKGIYYPAGNNFQTGKHELFPIPEDEMLINYKLNNKNNPGY